MTGGEYEGMGRDELLTALARLNRVARRHGVQPRVTIDDAGGFELVGLRTIVRLEETFVIETAVALAGYRG